MNKKGHIIRRKFLLREIPPLLSSLKGIEIEQGYIVQHPLRDLRLRREEKKHFIALREKIGATFLYKELPTSKKNFEALWPFTQGERVKRCRYLFFLKNLKWKIDLFLDDHNPLAIAEASFPSLAASKVFEKPDFLDEEITHCQEYETAQIALHGVPNPDSIFQVGIFPYLFKDRKLHVLLVTSSSGQRWILPKGRQEPDMTPHEVAIMEAAEEAGALGTLRPDIRIRCQMNNGRFLQLYAMKIFKLLPSWPEEELRLRRLLPINDALELMEDDSIIWAMKRLAKQLNKETSA